MTDLLYRLKNISRKRWLIFWSLILLLFMIICILSKKDDFIKSVKSQLPQNAVKISTNSKNKLENSGIIIKKPTKERIIKEDLNFKMMKDGKKFLISGVLSSKDDFYTLKRYYRNLVKNNLTYDKKRDNPKIISLVIALKSLADRFKSGFMDYSNGVLNIDGVVESKEDKDIIETTINNIKDIKTNAHIVVEVPKTKIKHIRKLSIVKIGNEIKISGTFTSIDELNNLVKLFKDNGFNVRKALCVIDSDIKEDRWANMIFAVKDYFIRLIKGTMQFDNGVFFIDGETNIEGLGQKIHNVLLLNKGKLKIEDNIVYIEPKKMIEKIQDKLNSILTLKHIRFKKGTDEITDDTKLVLDEVTETLKLLPNLKVEIRGYTDSDGSMMDNLKLSQLRAESVKKYLVNHGIKEEKLFPIGFGERNPIVKNNSKENKQINRRVEFKIIGD